VLPTLRVFAAELPFDGDVLVNSTPTMVLQLDIPPGRWLASATVALANYGDQGIQTDVWLTGTSSAGLTVAGPRAAQVDLPAGEVASVALGPVFVDAPGGVSGLVIAQAELSGYIVAREGTELLNRAGATGLLVWGGDALAGVTPGVAPD